MCATLKKWIEFFKLAYHRPGLQIARYALGKYIIAFCCLLHLCWALLIVLHSTVVRATPIAILYVLLGNSRTLVVALLIAVAVLAGCFLDLRLRKLFNLSVLSMLLIPQQLVLWCSAGAGLYAAMAQQYADGVHRSWAFILADQLPVILMALLYTVALLETRHSPSPSTLNFETTLVAHPGETIKVVGPENA